MVRRELIRVVLVHDGWPNGVGLRQVIDKTDDMRVVAACGGADAVAAVQRHRAQVVLLDMRVLDLDGPALLRALRDQPRPPSVAMLTPTDGDDLATQVTAALRAGAQGFLEETAGPELLVRSVRVLADGGSVLSPSVTNAVVDGFLTGTARADGWAYLTTMTEREQTILTLLGEGASDDEIGRRLFLGADAVDRHVAALLARLGASGRAQAAVVAHAAGFVAEAVPVSANRY